MAEITYPYGKNADGDLVNAKYAIRGEEYLCPQCEKGYDLRRGPKRRAYFAHKSDYRCSYESYLHKVAKEILYKNLKKRINSREEFFIGSYSEILYVEPFEGIIVKRETGKNLTYNNIVFEDSEIYLENIYGEYRPDILLKNRDNTFLIEIYVSNRCVFDKIKSNSVIEVKVNNNDDLEKLRKSSLKEGNYLRLYNYPFKESVKKILYEKAYVRMKNIIKTCHEKKKIRYSIERRIKNVKYKDLNFNSACFTVNEIIIGLNGYVLELAIVNGNYVLRISNNGQCIKDLCRSKENKIIGFKYEEFMNNNNYEIYINDYIIDKKLNYANEELVIEDPKTIIRVSGFQPPSHYKNTIKDIRIEELYEKIKNKEFELIVIEKINI
jgi:hypothetical protein